MIKFFERFKKKKAPPAPPEPGFSAPLKEPEKSWFSIRSYFEKGWVKLLVVLAVFLIAAALLSLGHKASKKKVQRPEVPEENRVYMLR